MPSNENALVIIHAQDTYIGDRAHLNSAADTIAQLTQQRPSGVGHVVHVLTIEAPEGAVINGENFLALRENHEGIRPLHDGIQVHPQDLVILTPARDANLFNVPGALKALQERGITNTAFTGFSTRQCVAASVSGGAENGFNLSIVADATGSSAFKGGGRSGPASPSDTALGLQELNDNFGARTILSEHLHTSDWQPNENSAAYVESLRQRDALADRYVRVMDETRFSGSAQERLDVAGDMIAAGFRERDFQHMFESRDVGSIAANDFRVAEGGKAAIASYLQNEAEPSPTTPLRQQATIDRGQLEDSLDRDRKRLLRDDSLDPILGEPGKPLDAASAEMLRDKIKSIEPAYAPLKAYYDHIAGHIRAGENPSAVIRAFSEARRADAFLVQNPPPVMENTAPTPTEPVAARSSRNNSAHPVPGAVTPPANSPTGSQHQEFFDAPTSSGNPSGMTDGHTTSHVKTSPAEAPHVSAPHISGARGGAIGALAVAGVEVVSALIQGVSPAAAAERGLEMAADNVMPGACNGFPDIRSGSIVDRVLASANTAIGIGMNIPAINEAATLANGAVGVTQGLIHGNVDQAARSAISTSTILAGIGQGATMGFEVGGPYGAILGGAAGGLATAKGIDLMSSMGSQIELSPPQKAFNAFYDGLPARPDGSMSQDMRQLVEAKAQIVVGEAKLADAQRDPMASNSGVSRGALEASETRFSGVYDHLQRGGKLDAVVAELTTRNHPELMTSASPPVASKDGYTGTGRNPVAMRPDGTAGAQLTDLPTDAAEARSVPPFQQAQDIGNTPDPRDFSRVATANRGRPPIASLRKPLETANTAPVATEELQPQITVVVSAPQRSPNRSAALTL